MQRTHSLNPYAPAWTPGPRTERTAETSNQPFNPADWAEHRSRLRACHQTDQDLRAVFERQRKTESNRNLLDARHKTERQAARTATRQIEQGLTRLQQRLDASLKLSPREVRRLLRELDRRYTELNTKQEALSRLQTEHRDCAIAIEQLELQTLSKPQSPHSPDTLQTAPHRRQALEQAADDLKTLLRAGRLTAQTLKKTLHQEIETKPALSRHLDGATLTRIIDTLTHTLIKRALTDALAGASAEHLSQADTARWIQEVLTRHLSQPIPPKALLIGLLQTIMLLAVGTSLIFDTRRKLAADAAARDASGRIDRFLVEQHDLWKIAKDIADIIDLWSAAGGPMGARTRLWRDSVRKLENSGYNPGNSLSRTLQVRDLLSFNWPYGSLSSAEDSQSAMFERALHIHHGAIMQKARDSHHLYDPNNIATVPEPGLTAFMLKLTGFLILIANASIDTAQLIRHNTQRRRAIAEAEQVATRIDESHRRLPQYRMLTEAGVKAHHALENIRRHSSQPINTWDESLQLAAAPDASLSELIAALSETRATLIEHSRQISDTPVTQDTPGFDHPLTRARQSLDTKETSLERKKSEIAALEKTIKALDLKLESNTDTTEQETLLAEITHERNRLHASLDAEEALQQRHQNQRRELMLRAVELSEQERELRRTLAGDETGDLLDPVRDAIKNLATPTALSLAMERHVGLSPSALESRLRSGRFTAGQGHEISTAPTELASTYHSIHALHLAIIDAIEKAPQDAAPGRTTIHHDTELGLTLSINDRNAARTTPALRSIVDYQRTPDGRLRVAHIHPA